MSGIGIITNPRSRQNKRNPHLAHRLGYIIGEKGVVEQPGDLQELDQVAERFRDNEVEVVCVNGGDGTIHKALTAMSHAYGNLPMPKIALLRGGTMNTVAHGLGIKGSPAELTQYILDRYHFGLDYPSTRRWLLKVNGEYCGFLFGMGLVPRFLDEYYKSHDPSPFKAVVLFLRVVFSLLVGGSLAKGIVKPEKVRVTVDGREWIDGDLQTVLIGTVDDIGFGAKAFFKSILYPGKMHAWAFGPNPMDILREIPRIYLGRTPKCEEVTETVAKKVVIESETPIVFMLDGDIYPPTNRIEIEIGAPVDLVLPGA